MWPLFFLTLAVSAEFIPRELLFSEPKYSAISLSPDGKVISFVAPNEKGVRNLFTRCVTCKHTQQVTFEDSNSVLGYQWTGVPNVLIYAQDNQGDENTMLFKLNVSEASPEKKPFVISNAPHVKAMIAGNNRRDSRILIALNDETPVFHNLYSFDLFTNELTIVFKNKRFPRFVVDNDLQVRLVSEEGDDGSVTYYKPSAKANLKELTSDKESWVEYLTVSYEDKPISQPMEFSRDNKKIYWIWGEGSDLGSLVVHDFDHPEEREVLYTATKAQIGSVMFHPVDKSLLAVTEVYHRPELFVANDTVMADLQYLVNLRPRGSLQIMSLSNDFHTWLLTYTSDETPYEIYLYRRWEGKAEFLFNTHPRLEGHKLNRMVGFDFPARDNLIIQAYLSLPPEAKLRSAEAVDPADKVYAEIGLLPERRQKLIVLVHGGPELRDHFGFSAYNAWLTSRGYAVLQVNFRGSTGFGKRHTNAGHGEWGRKMHFDLLDAIEFAVAKGIANRSEIAIMGGSYGGYATLVGLTFTPDVFRCGVDIVGMSNLVSMVETIPPYWLGYRNSLIKMLGADINTQEGVQSLRSRSPLFFADRVRTPLLILHGANDPRVKQAESDQFVEALKAKNIPVTYVLYPDEGHGFRRQENRLAEAGFTEHFLHQCMGGDYENFDRGQYGESAKVLADTSDLLNSRWAIGSRFNPRVPYNRRGPYSRPVNPPQMEKILTTMG